MKIVFFEDEYFDDENANFIRLLKCEVPNVDLLLAGSFKKFESFLDRHKIDLFILDMMGAENDVLNWQDGTRISSSLLGLEMVQRIRSGCYPKQDPQSLILIRSARVDEIKISRLLNDYNVTDLFIPGRDDNSIIESIRNKV